MLVFLLAIFLTDGDGINSYRNILELIGSPSLNKKGPKIITDEKNLVVDESWICRSADSPGVWTAFMVARKRYLSQRATQLCAISTGANLERPDRFIC